MPKDILYRRKGKIKLFNPGDQNQDPYFSDENEVRFSSKPIIRTLDEKCFYIVADEGLMGFYLKEKVFSEYEGAYIITFEFDQQGHLVFRDDSINDYGFRDDGYQYDYKKLEKFTNIEYIFRGIIETEESGLGFN
jgi:hypothetical protein